MFNNYYNQQQQLNNYYTISEFKKIFNELKNERNKMNINDFLNKKGIDETNENYYLIVELILYSSETMIMEEIDEMELEKILKKNTIYK